MRFGMPTALGFDGTAAAITPLRRIGGISTAWPDAIWASMDAFVRLRPLAVGQRAWSTFRGRRSSWPDSLPHINPVESATNQHAGWRLGNFPSVFQVFPHATYRLVVDSELGGDLAIRQLVIVFQALLQIGSACPHGLGGDVAILSVVASERFSSISEAGDHLDRRRSRYRCRGSVALWRSWRGGDRRLMSAFSSTSIASWTPARLW